ncbi:MAG: Cna B-type domain-containing protein [Lachnospiraceae bacterium]|nr:Cna B-type domain-containing protein [Lachnospiraceae bacterium]
MGSQISVPSITGFAEEKTEVTAETETQASTTAQTTASTTAETAAAETQASTTAQTTASTAAETAAATTATETSSTVTESTAADVISTNSSQEKDASAGSAEEGSAQSETLQSESSQSETATPNETLVDSGNENGTSSGTGTDTDTQSESETSETELAAESETETGTETDSDIETESDMETESETESESETTAETEELQIKATLKAETETETETETVTEAENEDETQNASNAPIITVTKENAYTINVKWEISGTSDESVQLAICMDEITYDSLLNSCAEEVEDKANKGEYYCRIQLNDSKNTVLTLKKTYIEEDDDLYGTYYAKPTAKEPNPIVRLVYEQTGDTDAEGLEWEFTIEAASVEDDTTSTLLAQWYKEAEEDADAETQTEDGSSVSEEENEWKTLDVVRVRWSQMEEETESETEEETETESGIEIETESETETESESDTEAESESETESESGIEAENEYETEFETEIECDTDTETEVESETDTETETDVKSETEIETEVGYVGVTASLTSAEPVAISEDGDEPESEKESESESETADVTTVNSVDLSAYLTGTDAEVDSDTNAIMVSLSYKINTSVLQEAGTNVVTYQIPDNISAKKEYSGSVMDGNTVVGSYTISTDGLITIVFNEDYVNGTPADITGSISFWARTSQEEVGDDDTLEIVFNDEYTITVKIDKTSFSDFDVTVDKSCTDTVVDKENAVITFYYKVEITTVNGTGTTLNFDDILSNQLEKAEYSELSISKYNAGGNEVSDFDGSTVAIVAGTASTDPSLSGTLPSLDAGEKYVVTYTVTRTLDEDEDGAYVSNTAKVSNTYTGDIDYSSQSASLYDLSVKKTSADSPVLDREAGTVTNVYQVTVSTTLGTKDEIDLLDKISFWSNDSTDDFTYDFTVSSITKYTTDTETGEVISSEKLDLDTLDMNGDALEGTLPALEAGEYYIIEYTAVLSELPEDSMTTFSMMNSVSVSDGANQQENWDSDYITWVGSGYVNWISKTGTYNASSNTITWKIVLNEGGYGDLNGMNLSDILSQNGVELNDSIQVSISEKISYTEYPYTGTFTLPYTFKNGEEVSTWGGADTLTVDTTHEFIITYTTTVDNENVNTFFNTYTNTAKIDEHEATAEVSIAENELNKTFKGSTPYTGNEYEGGYVLSWQTAVDIPKNGLAKGSYYTDEISDSSSGQQNNKNWFTVSLLNDMNLSVDGTDLSKDDYTISCTGTTAGGTAFTDVALSDVVSGSIISAYKITFNKAITGEQLVINYSSYSSTTDLAYNTGTYTVDGDTVSDEASGKGDDGTLVSKYNADGSTALKKELADIQDTNLDGSPYLLTYKLVINENNSASGDITITDTLPEGASLYTSKWKYSITWDGQLSWSYKDVFKEGVYFFYQPYDEKNYSYAYSNTSENTTRIAYFSDSTVYGDTALTYGVGVSYDDSSRKMTITIPQDAYLDSKNGTNHTMVLYYAVEIDPSVMEGYEYDFENKVEVTSTTGLADDDSLTDTLVSSSVEKKGSYNDTTNSVSYEVYINPEGVKVADSGGTLKIHDTFAFTARSNSTWNYYIEDVNLLPDSLKLWKQTDVSGVTAWKDCSDKIIFYSLEVSGHYAYLTVEVPDGEYYKLTYSYVLTYSDEAEEQISSADGLSLDVTNTVKIDGLGSMGNSTSDTTGIEASGSQASASKGYANITLYKRDSENELLMLEGAEFELERYDGTSWVSVKNEDSSTFITDEDGKVQLGDKLDESTYRISYNFLYRLREVKAPEGYTILSDYMYFYVASDDNSTIVGPDGWETAYKNKLLTVVNDAYIFVDNEAQDEDTTAFAIRKVWQDASGNTISSPTDSSGQSLTSVTVNLYKKVGDKTSWVKTVYLTQANDWSVLVENLPVYENSELIYYYVDEATPNGWTVSYSNNSGLISADTTDTQIVVTNTEVSDDTVSASVSKTWLKADGSEYSDAPEDSVTVTLKRSYTIPGTTAVVEETDGGNNVAASSSGTVTITVNVTDGTETKTETLNVAVDSEVKIYIESPGFSHLEGITTFSPSVSPTYTWTTAERTIDNENVWVSCEALTFYATEDTTVTIGNEWASYSMGTLELSITGNTVEGGETITDAGFSKTITLSDANNWSYSWGALPKCSSYGTEYTYWIEEIAPSGYFLVVPDGSQSSNKVVAEVDSGGSMTFTVKNQRMKDIDTSITVKKNWQYPDGTEISAEDPAGELLSSAELMLYRSTEKTTNGSIPADAELIDTVKVTKSADWTYTWNYLDKYADNDTRGSLYYYYVVEASTGELYEASYSGNGVNSTTTEEPVVVTNTIKTTEISVKKTWLDADGNEKTSGNPGSVVVQLYRKADEVGKEDTAYGEAVTLGTAKSASENYGTAPEGYSDDGWTYTWTDLLLGDYYVVETTLEGFSTSYEITVESNTEPDPGAGVTTKTENYTSAADAAISSGTITVKNQEIPVEITVTKQWGTGVTETEVDVQLYRSTSRPAKTVKIVTVYQQNDYGTQTLLQAKQIDTDYLSLTVESSSWGSAPSLQCTTDQKVVVGDATDSGTSYTFDVSNITTDITLVLYTNATVSAITISDALSSSSTGDNGLLSVESTDEEKVSIQGRNDNSVTLRTQNNWTYTWSDLPRVNEEGEIYYYYVKETTTSSSFESSYSYTFNEDGSIDSVTILNTTSLTTSITAQKKWVDSLGNEKSLADWSVTLNLYRKNADGEWELYALDSERTITNNTEDATVKWENLPAGEYYVEEVSMDGTAVDASNYTITYSNDSAANPSTQPEDASTMGGSEDGADIVITNTEGSTEITVAKKWTDGSSNHTGESVTMNLYASTTDPATAESESQAVQGKTVTVQYYDDNGIYSPYLASGIISGDAADIKIYYSSNQPSNITEHVYLSNGGAQITPSALGKDSVGQYLLFKIEEIKEKEVTFTFYVTNEATDGEYWPEKYDTNTVLDAEGAAGFSTLVNPVSSSLENEIDTVLLSSSNRWTATWTDLPLTNASGEKLYYYVEEKTLSNCSTSYSYTYNTDGSISKVTVTNRPVSGNTNIAITKRWTASDGEALTAGEDWAVTVQLFVKSSTGDWEEYKDANNQIVTKKLSSSNNWTDTFSNLPNGEYYVKEISMSGTDLVEENYTAAYQINTQTASENAEEVSTSGGGTITITNTETPTSLTVSKVWVDEKGTDVTDSMVDCSVQVKLYSSTTKPDVVESSIADEYTIELKNQNGYAQLAKKTVNSTSARLYVVYGGYSGLTSSTGYSLSLQSGLADIDKITEDGSIDYIVDSNGTECICIKFDLTNIQSDCVLWVVPADENMWPMNDGSIIEELAVEATNPAGEWVSVGYSSLPSDVTVSSAKYVGTSSLTPSNDWSYTWDDLPTHDACGNQLYYYIVEDACAGYTTSYEHYYRDDGTIEAVRVTNTYDTDAATTEIGVVKDWKVSDITSDSDYQVTVQLWKHKRTGTGNVYKDEQVTNDKDGNTISEVTLTSENNWSGIWKNLTPISDSGEYYFVKEVKVTSGGSENTDVTDNYIATYANNERKTSGTVQITNTEKTEISVTKQWKETDSENKVIDMPEEDCPDSVSVTLRRVVTSTSGSGTSTTYEEVETVELGKAYADSTSDTGKYDSTGWKYTWTSLPTGTYYVVESGTNSSEYTTTYLVDGDEEKDYGVLAKVRTGNITITNKAVSARPETIDVTVNKKWVYSDDKTTVTDEDLLPESVTFALYYSRVSPDTLESEGKTFPEGNDLVAYDPETEGSAETEVVKADSNGDWTVTWTDLPKYADDGTTLYYYYVKETCIDGTEIITSTMPVYENNGSAGDTDSNPITVTNTIDTASVTVKKTWKDAGGNVLGSSITSGYTVTFQLYQWVEDNTLTGGGTWKLYGDEITLSSNSATDSTGTTIERNSTEEWTYIWTHLPAGKYYVEETSTTAKGGFTVSYHSSAMNEETDPDKNEASEAVVVVTATDTGNTGSNSGTITINNQKESTEISVEKIWKDSNGETDPDQSETVTMYLYRTTTPLTEAQTEALQIIAAATDNEYTKGTSGGATIKCSGSLSEFVSVAVDGTTVDTENYTKAEGSTIITFTQSYLDTLSIGDHSVILYYTGDRSISATLTIKEKESVVTTETEDFTVSMDWGTNTAPTTGSVTAFIYSCDSEGSNTGSEAVATLILTNESGWSRTVALSSATLTNDKVTAYYYYKVVIEATSIETDSGTYMVVSSERIMSEDSEVETGTTVTVSGTFTEKPTETQSETQSEKDTEATEATEATTVSLTVAIDTWLDTSGSETTNKGGWIWVQVLDSNGTDAGNATLSSDNSFTTTFSGLENGATYTFKYSCSTDLSSKQWQNIKNAKVTGSSSTAAETGEKSITLNGDTAVGLTATYYQPETTTLTFTVDTTSWDSGVDTTDGKITVSIYTGDSGTYKYGGTLNVSDEWSWTSGEIYWGSDASYKIVYDCDGTAITAVSGTEILAGGDGTKITLSATLADSSFGSGPWTVTVYASNSNSSYDGGLVTNSNITSSTITVLILFNYNIDYTAASLITDAKGVTIGNAEKKLYGGVSGNNYYLVFEVTGISGDCDLTLYPTDLYPMDKNYNNLIIDGPASEIKWDDETASIQSYEEILTASLITNSHTFTTSGENESGGSTIESESESEIDGLYASNETEKYDEITLGNTTSNKLSYTWSNLDKYDADGNLYYYYIVEESVGGYTSSYSTNVTITTTSTDGQVTGITTTIDKVTVTNIQEATEPEPISVSVEKKWSGYNEGNSNEYDEFTVLVKLTRDKGDLEKETEIELIPLGNAYSGTPNYTLGGWSYTWNNLESGHTYSVEEVGIYAKYGTSDQQEVGTSKYSSSYVYTLTDGTELGVTALTQSDTIIITNTKTSGQGITLPGTGSKYPLIFYGLGLTFLAVSTTWMLYAFKKKKKYKYAGKGGVKPDSS